MEVEGGGWKENGTVGRFTNMVPKIHTTADAHSASNPPLSAMMGFQITFVHLFTAKGILSTSRLNQTTSGRTTESTGPSLD